MDEAEAEQYEPGRPAPVSGLYDEHDPRGMRTGVTVMAEKGRALPRLPRGYFWRFKIDPPGPFSAFAAGLEITPERGRPAAPPRPGAQW